MVNGCRSHCSHWSLLDADRPTSIVVLRRSPLPELMKHRRNDHVGLSDHLKSLLQSSMLRAFPSVGMEKVEYIQVNVRVTNGEIGLYLDCKGAANRSAI